MKNRIILPCGCADECTDKVIRNWHKDHNITIMALIKDMIKRQPHMKDEIRELLEAKNE